MTVIERPLGRLPATDDRHIQLFALTDETMPEIPTPVTIGINWYSAFDAPTKKSDGTRWLPTSNWGRVRGGHAVCLKPPLLMDPTGWWDYYNQGMEGACVGFASSRMMSLLNRERYDGFKLYYHAQKVDEWPGENYSGTSVRAAMDVLRKYGPYGRTGVQEVNDGIIQNRWATSMNDLAYCLDPWTSGQRVLNAGYVIMLNSWGRGYPHYTRIALESLNTLLFRENGDAAVVVDRR